MELLLCRMILQNFIPEKKRKIDIQDGRHLQVVPILPTKFLVNWLFDSEVIWHFGLRRRISK